MVVMFGLSAKRVKAIKKIVEGGLVEYNPDLKLFRITMVKHSLSPEQTKKISKAGLVIDEIINHDNGQWDIILRNKFPWAKVVIFGLSVELWLFAIIILTLLENTNFKI